VGEVGLGSLLEPEVADVARHCWAMREQHPVLVNRAFRLPSGVCDSDELSFEVFSRKVAIFSSWEVGDELVSRLGRGHVPIGARLPDLEVDPCQYPFSRL
jgi:hypothetical protein